MARIVPIVVRRDRVVEVPVPVGDRGELDRERLTYELPEVAPPAAAAAAAAVGVDDVAPDPLEDARAAALIRAPEDAPPQLADVLARVRASAFAGHPAADAEESLILRALLDHPDPAEAAPALTVVDRRVHPDGVEDVLLSATILGDDVQRQPVDAITGVVIPAAAVQDDPMTEQAQIGRGFAPLNVTVSNTGWQFTNDADGNPNLGAELIAQSSGIGGVTSNTTTGNLLRAIRAFDFGWADELTEATAIVDASAVVGGAPLGGNFDVFFAAQAVGAGTLAIRTVTAAQARATTEHNVLAHFLASIGTNRANWNTNRMRLTGQGSVTSGTGIGASRTVFWFRGFLRFVVRKELAA